MRFSRLRRTEHVTAAALCRWLRGASIAGTLALAMIAMARAQSDYPNRPVQLIVAYGPGGIGDTGARILADKLTGRLKQPFVVENRPGAGGIVAAKAGASAAPDGYTVLVTGNNNAISESLFKSLPYNVLTDFASTSTLSFFDLLIVTRAGSPLKSVQDVAKMARANPGRLNIATINVGRGSATPWLCAGGGHMRPHPVLWAYSTCRIRFRIGTF